MQWHSLLLLTLLPSLAAGIMACGDSGGPDCASLEEPPSLTVGTGETSFQPLASGDTLEVVPGPAGGFYVVAGVGARGFYPGDQDEIKSFYEGPLSGDYDNSPTADYTIRSAEADLGTESWKYPLQGGQRFGDVVRIDGVHSTDDVLALDGTAGSISLTLADVCGNEQSTTVDVVFELAVPND